LISYLLGSMMRLTFAELCVECYHRLRTVFGTPYQLQTLAVQPGIGLDPLEVGSDGGVVYVEVVKRAGANGLRM
jgi:hypothetical protein